MEPFCFASPALLAPSGSRATSAAAAAAAAAATAARGSARQSRGGAGGLGGPGGGRAGWAFPLPGRAPAGTTSFSPPAAGSPARPPPSPPPPGPHFSGGANQKEKVSQEGLAGARPGRRGLSAAQGQPGRGGRLLFLVLRGAGRPRAAKGKRLSFSSRLSPQCPGRVGQWSAGTEARPGLSPTGGPAAWRVACSPRCALGLGGRGPKSSARSPRAAPRHSRAHTPSSGLLSAGDDGRGPGERARANVCGYPSHPRTFPEAAQTAVGSWGPHV